MTSVSLFDVIEENNVQILTEERNFNRRQMMKERLGTRIVSTLEIAIHICGESIVYNTFYVRQLWIVQPTVRKKYIEDGMVRKGVLEGVQLRQYHCRETEYESDTFEKFYSRATVCHTSDKGNGVTILPNHCSRQIWSMTWIFERFGSV